MRKFFYLEESPFYKNKYVVKMNHELFLFPHGTSGSYNVFMARVMNLSFADFLRYTRDRLGAELVGKNSRYVVPYFEKTATVLAFIKLLNTRMEYIMHEHEHPYDYVEDKDGNVTVVPFNNESNS